MKTKYCPLCKAQAVYEDDKYCYRDGEGLVEVQMHECGRMLSPCDKFCPKCGKELQHAA
jgi:uncharacterized OB-fold protein